MELRESIEEINRRLISEYGRDLSTNLPNFRIVFSENEYEKRLTGSTYEGFELLVPEVHLLPKYKQWIREKYILERLIPIVGETDLTTKMSYESIWVFQDRKGNYLPPFFDGCKFIIETIYTNINNSKSPYVKYKDKNKTEEERLSEIERVEKELFGNETDVGDALAYDYGVSYAGLDGRREKKVN